MKTHTGLSPKAPPDRLRAGILSPIMVKLSSPLFPMASRAIRTALMGEFQKSPAGKLLRAATQVSRYGGRSSGLQRLLTGGVKRLITMSPTQRLRGAMGTEFGELLNTVERYRRGGNADKATIELFLQSLGPAGDLLKSLVDAGVGKQQGLPGQLNMMATILQAHGYKVSAEGVPKARLSEDILRQAIQQIEEEGGMVFRAGLKGEPTRRKLDLPYGISPTTKTGEQRRVVDLPTARGAKRYPVDHPIVTGEMVRTPNSTNVHSVGYDIESRLLYVRFKADSGKGKKSGPGSIYRYSPVTPEEFDSLYRVHSAGNQEGPGASSPGTWAWEHLRVRGSMHAHHKDYELVGIMRDHVPRKATLNESGQAIYKQRQDVQTTRGRYLSSRATEVVGFNRNQVTGRPGEPNRAKPKTGRV